MRTLFIIPLVLLSLVSFPSWSLTIDDLVERGGVYYKKFTDVPFNGKVEGTVVGEFMNGKREGYWLIYWDNGQLSGKGEYREGKKVGLWEGYWENGQLKYRGEIKDGLRNGSWVSFWEDGTVDSLNTGTWKNGRLVSE